MRTITNTISTTLKERFLGVTCLWSVLLVLGMISEGLKAQPFVYVAHRLSDSVSVIDSATNTVVATLPNLNNARDVHVVPDGTRAYVKTADLFVIDTATNTASLAVFVAQQYYQTSTSHQTALGLTSLPARGGSDIMVVDIDPASPTFHTRVASFLFQPTVESYHVTISPDGKEAYVTGLNSSTLVVVDTDPASPTFNSDHQDDYSGWNHLERDRLHSRW